jgi:hypothetical protein
MGTIVEEISARALGIGAHVVLGDQREEASLSVLYAQQGVQFKSYAWSEPSKDEAVQWLRRAMRERRVHLPEHPETLLQLRTLKARLQPSGRIRYESSGLDFVSCLITLAHAVCAGDLHVESGALDIGITRAPIRNNAERVTAGYGPGPRRSDEEYVRTPLRLRDQYSRRPRRRGVWG